MQATQAPTRINGIDVDFIRDSIKAIAENPALGHTTWNITTEWKGGTRSDSHVTGYHIGGQFVPRQFTLSVDEPTELGGTNTFANPQEYLLSAMNACMLVGYVVACSFHGVELEALRIETCGEIDLRGFLGIDPTVTPGYEELEYTVHLKGRGTAEQFRRVHETVCATSPNRHNIANPIRLKGNMVVE